MAVTMSATQLALNRRDEFMLLVWVRVDGGEATKTGSSPSGGDVGSRSIPFLKKVS
jgi:hypothetical protein